MVKLNNVLNPDTKIDTYDCLLTMYKAMNWIPTRFIVGGMYEGNLPTVVYFEGKKYELVDGYCTTRHYEAVDDDSE